MGKIVGMGRERESIKGLGLEVRYRVSGKTAKRIYMHRY